MVLGRFLMGSWLVLWLVVVVGVGGLFGVDCGEGKNPLNRRTYAEHVLGMWAKGKELVLGSFLVDF